MFSSAEYLEVPTNDCVGSPMWITASGENFRPPASKDAWTWSF
jgi:hypothetical protein